MQPAHSPLLPAAAFLLPLLGALSASANIVVNFADTQAVAGYSQETMNAIAGTSFYFEHASVGGNMVAGLNTLHSGNASFYRLTTSSASATAPASLAAGTVYDYDRGNPGWQAKVDGFAADISGSWGGRTTFAMSKFCYIDPDASWTYYRDSMLALEAANPTTNFVYMTIPLTADSGSDNVLRGNFNNALRTWAAANNRIVFDIADIEAHSAGGALQTFSSGGQTYQRLAADWTSDGGHLNTAGQALVAKGFYALAAEVVAIPEPSAYALALGVATLRTVLWRRRPFAARWG